MPSICKNQFTLREVPLGKLRTIMIANRPRKIRPSWIKGGLAETWGMVWRLLATKLKTAETMEGVDCSYYR